MPARTLNDFFAGFFCHPIKADREVEMAKAKRPEKNHRRENSRIKGDIKTSKIEGKEDKEQEVIVVRHETVPQAKAKSTWS